MELLCYDPYENPLALEMGARYCSLEEIYANADVISLHCPMSEENYHLLNENAFAQMKDGVMIINTSRGELLDSVAAIEALKQGKIGALGLDVYDNEKDLFFKINPTTLSWMMFSAAYRHATTFCSLAIKLS